MIAFLKKIFGAFTAPNKRSSEDKKAHGQYRWHVVTIRIAATGTLYYALYHDSNSVIVVSGNTYIVGRKFSEIRAEGALCVHSRPVSRYEAENILSNYKFTLSRFTTLKGSRLEFTLSAIRPDTGHDSVVVASSFSCAVGTHAHKAGSAILRAMKRAKHETFTLKPSQVTEAFEAL